MMSAKSGSSSLGLIESMDNLLDDSLGSKTLWMGRGREWDVGGGNLCCVLCCVAQVDATHGLRIMTVHHSTIIPKKLHNLTYCTFV